jgi:NAD(P)-dependent dehydrogenase (short-subunit alcohol dehydrogenase family)
MKEGNELHIVVGASGATGRVVARELAAWGKRVRAINRSGRASVPDGVEVLAADATPGACARPAGVPQYFTTARCHRSSGGSNCSRP